MTSISLQGNLSPDAAEAFSRLSANKIDTTKDGDQLLAKDCDVSYFAVVRDRGVKEYYCVDSSGTRLPVFFLRGRVHTELQCYVCYIDREGQQVHCQSTSCDYL